VDFLRSARRLIEKLKALDLAFSAIVATLNDQFLNTETANFSNADHLYLTAYWAYLATEVHKGQDPNALTKSSARCLEQVLLLHQTLQGDLRVEFEPEAVTA
jgi:hypothetical protein